MIIRFVAGCSDSESAMRGGLVVLKAQDEVAERFHEIESDFLMWKERLTVLAGLGLLRLSSQA